jgi:hypothetical protein
MSRIRSSSVGRILLVIVTVAMFDAIGVLPVSFIREAHARIGRPLTPASYAGVRRRTARRSVCAATAVTVAASSTASSAASAQAAAQQQAAYAQQEAAAQQQAAIAQQQAAAEQQAAIAEQQAAIAQQQAIEAQRQAAAAQQSTPAIQLPVGTVLPSLPQGCESVTIGGASYFRCGPTWLKPALSGGQIVYMVAADPN